ncbi:MAG: hypothetical protein JNG88_10400 [Phycisphaerales bacterium]|nr:hypothetical protein [Phycisphaerales bacterium]
MAFKLCESAAKHWRALNGAKLLPEVIAGRSSSTEKKPKGPPPDYVAINDI